MNAGGLLQTYLSLHNALLLLFGNKFGTYEESVDLKLSKTVEPHALTLNDNTSLSTIFIKFIHFETTLFIFGSCHKFYATEGLWSNKNMHIVNEHYLMNGSFCNEFGTCKAHLCSDVLRQTIYIDCYRTTV